MKRKLEWLFNQCSGTISYVIDLFGSIEKFYEFFESSPFRCLSKFLDIYPQFKYIEFVDGNFLIDDFEVDYCGQGEAVFS